MNQPLNDTHSFFRTTEGKTPQPLEPICEAIGKDINRCWYTHPIVVLNYIGLITLLVREIVELVYGGWEYFSHTRQNYLQIIQITLAAVFVFLVPSDLILANHFGAWATFLAWANLSRFLGKTYYFGRIITMAWYVTKKILNIFIIFTPSFAAFIFAFDMLLQSHPMFHRPADTTLKVLSMMVGEFTYDETFSFEQVYLFGGRNISTQVRR